MFADSELTSAFNSVRSHDSGQLRAIYMYHLSVTCDHKVSVQLPSKLVSTNDDDAVCDL